MAENAEVSESTMSSEMQNGVEKPELGIPGASSPEEATERSPDLYSAVKSEDLETVVENSEEIRTEEENGRRSEIKVIEGNDRDPRNAAVESEIEEVEVGNEELESASEGGKVYTMRELLDELKEKKGVKVESNGQKEEESITILEREVSNEIERNASQSQESRQQQLTSQNDVAIDLITSVSATDEEGRSRQRILTFAAKRYAASLERNPRDYDALYNWALVLQESADNVGPNVTSPSKDSLLEEACKKYEEATRLCPTLHDAFYNWAIAISDRARIRGRTKEAEELWKQATNNYEKAVQLNWNSPQALNNWGLALQELSAIVPAKEKQSIVRTAISKFRAAIRLQFDFHRAIYNLGTVLYGLAEDTLRTGRQVSAKEAPPNDLYSQSAIYIAAAHALKPTYSVYRSALRLVRSMLPLPYLKVGYLHAPPAVNTVAPHGDWKRSQFVLNHEGLQQVKLFDEEKRSPSSKFLSSINTEKPLIKVNISDIVLVSACTDLTLPPGAGFCIDTDEGPLFLVADSLESMDGWLDAIRLVYTIYARGKSDVLAAVITG